MASLNLIQPSADLLQSLQTICQDVDEQSDEHLLSELELHVQQGDFTLRLIAAQDRLFLQHELYLIGFNKSVNELEDVLRLTSALLDRLQDPSGSYVVRRSSGLAEDSLSGELTCDKFAANLQHLLRSLQQIALEAIIRHYLNVIEANLLHGHLHWQHSKRLGEGWFAEWPNGHRPLSTTWPWNIKPSLSYATSVPLYPYISAPEDSSSDHYPTSTVTWPYCQGINPGSSPAYAPSYSPWQTQSPFHPTGGVTTTPQRTDRSNIVQPYVQRTQTADTGNPQVAAGSLGFGLGLHMSDMQDYPSPGSSTSGQTTSSYVSVLPPNVLSSGMPLMPSPSVAGSTGSRQSSRRSQEPLRNAEGLLYCSHAEHAQQQPPVFSRKCEWKKHMDKHERPYVCEEPECDNIRGFTYSGGLLRHQREVHRQHGGPKASSMCPYPDCKRHVGVGFSRKENLAEHLRRVHRDAGADQTQEEGPESAQNTTSATSGTGRKRRRAVPDDDSGGEDDLEQEVKKLKKELQEKDERLEKLERQVELLIRGQKQ
ncbi:hypothetical protein HO133_002109 [Letharia lupina]|uniref:C2H2-type domain-containing protein n=1 Tax=Letharia lupina TaxID=560253 RepID=A0A8H6FB27_9LECA|nr:uncharacterized protein HO133_002109 [Letharia lupina]KAF6221254.1 hypothetical protein HO133_002109 [Letharia lupina]